MWLRWMALHELRKLSYDQLLERYIQMTEHDCLTIRERKEIEAVYDVLKEKQPMDRKP